MKKGVPLASIRSIQLPFDWIDVLAVPVATSIMETQPYAVVLLLFTLLITGNSSNVPLDAASITLLLLGLHWWTQLVKYMTRHSLNDKQAGAFQFFGLLLALALTLVTHLTLLNNVPVLLFVIALVAWFWMRSKKRARVELSEEHLLFSFKLCFVVLLSTMLIILPVNPNISGTMLAAIAIAFPLFFGSGLVALSFIRLSTTRHEYRRDAFSTRLYRTRAWSLFFVLTWGMLVVVTILLELFSFQILLIIFAPLINAIDDAILFILHLFAQKPVPTMKLKPILPLPTPSPRQTIPVNFTLSPLIVIVVLVISGVILLAGLLFILYEMLLARVQRSEVEQRENLDVRSILAERRKRNKQRKTKFRLDALNPNSVRACYRDLLLATARRGGDIPRHPDETPTEYQQRLLSVVTSLPNKEGEPTNTTILTELTEAYMLERYGRKQTEQAQVRYFKRLVQQLVKKIRRYETGL